MTRHSDFKAAVGAAKSARHNALYRKRDAGDPRNPFQAKAGRESEFYEAAQSVRAYDLILKLLENEAKRAAREKTRPTRSRVKRFLDRVLDIFIGAGLASLATLGFAAAFTLLQLPAPIIQATAIIGVSAALARAVSRK